MAKYLFTVSYSAEGLKGLYKDKASGRMAAIARTVEGLGGKLESGYFALGEHDVILIVDLPDNVAASAVSLTASSTGLLRAQTTALLTPEETDKALGTSVNYRGPGT
ncbi:MAG: GYD domain-containing protein [Acidobacteria bacterium]|nr:GYD domain-containing protein [Acidobacteriota bacterium]MBV9482280.1 GYD domain-containing protein [Acidobacteriota bacterium]